MTTTINATPRLSARTSARPATPAVRGRRRPAAIIAGAVLVVVLTATFMWLQLRSDHTVAVLAVSRPVAAGATITAADLRTAHVIPDPTVELIDAADAATVVGRTAATPLLAGTLLSPHQVGPAVFPATGQAVIAVPVPAGRLPVGLTAGSRVQVITIATTSSTGAGPPPGAPATAPVGTAIAVTPGVDAAGTTVVSLLLPTDAALTVAGSPGQITLAVLPPTN
jgi:hypothetical protein